MVCVITDNSYIYEGFKALIENKKNKYKFYYSENNRLFNDLYRNNEEFSPISLKKCDPSTFDQYEMILSLHCKQIFPEWLVNNHRCINVHPGLNPYNRGWFPQTFSIINKLPAGVTIHEMDTELDHGPIIYQERLEIHSYDTSKDVYERILKVELELIKNHLDDLVNGTYTTHPMDTEGNINYKSDFDLECRLDLDKTGTFSDFYDLLRALTFPPYKNAYFIDENGEKIYISLNISKSNE